jgi:putative pyruvate formate lyase activating enzyme
MQDLYHHCQLCPRQCGAARHQRQLGFCHCDDRIHVGAICVHHGEEPVFGPEGMVNVFFTHCNLRCSYCQNYQISHDPVPEVDYCLTLEETVRVIERQLTAERRVVGFVSPSHVWPSMVAVIQALRQRQPDVVTVMNSNGYDDVAMLQTVAPYVDVYLPDFKYNDPHLAQAYSQAADYPKVVRAALKEMTAQKGTALVLDEKGVIRSGLIIRHLVLPGAVKNSKACLRFIARSLSPQLHVSLMAQYGPTPAVFGHEYLGRKLRAWEYEDVLKAMEELGLENGWVQALESSGNYVPDFRQTHPFAPIV